MNTQLQAISALEILPQRVFDKDTTCWNCHDRPRHILYPNYGGSIYSIYCVQCSSAGRVLQRLEEESR